MMMLKVLDQVDRWEERGRAQVSTGTLSVFLSVKADEEEPDEEVDEADEESKDELALDSGPGCWPRTLTTSSLVEVLFFNPPL